MHIKWIICKVKDNFEKEFSVAQSQWGETKNTDGFIGQVGGWDLNNDKTACIISFWEDEASLNLFMENTHDRLFFNNSQSDYFDSIEVSHFNSLLKMDGKYDSLIESIKDGHLLRIADCVVKEDRIEHFESTQKEVWIPGMKNVQGMLGGVFSKVKTNTARYLVATFWDSIQNHEKYIEQQLPKLKIESDVNTDISNIIGRKIRLVDSWNITGL